MKRWRSWGLGRARYGGWHDRELGPRCQVVTEDLVLGPDAGKMLLVNDVPSRGSGGVIASVMCVLSIEKQRVIGLQLRESDRH
jgi:hypothetical protein